MQYQNIYTACIDVISSTKIVNEQSTFFRDKFYNSLVETIIGDLKEYDLDEPLLKFTGDGYLISIIGPGKLLNLLCFLLILNRNFSSKMNKSIGLDKIKIDWKIRIGVAFGFDLIIEIAGKKDCIGDSIRRSVRISSICLPNEVLVSQEIKSGLFRDFHFSSININKRFAELKTNLKFENDIQDIYKIDGLKISDLCDVDLKLKTASLLNDISAIETIIKESKTKEEFISENNSKDYNSLMAHLRLKGDDINLKFFENKLHDKGLKKGIIYYNKLINYIADFESAKAVLNEMKEAGIQPNEVSYTTLMNKVADFESAKAVLNEMKEAGIQPNEVSYTTLMNKVADFESAKAVLNEMKEAGIQPNEKTFSTLFKKEVTSTPINEILNWYWKEKYNPSNAIEPLIKKLYKEHRLIECFMIILNYPHLPSSRKILLVNPNKSQALLFSLKEESYYKRNIDYALGILFYYQGMTKQSEYHLRIALKLASHKIKIKSIIEMLEKIKS